MKSIQLDRLQNLELPILENKNASDLDYTCSSIDIDQDNIDCYSTCNGNAFIDGCGNCVGGETGEIECNEDCNGVNGGSAQRDDCDVCAGGDTGLEPNQDLDCNGVCDPSTCLLYTSDAADE
mgnify:CR=1 FL=1